MTKYKNKPPVVEVMFLKNIEGIEEEINKFVEGKLSKHINGDEIDLCVATYEGEMVLKEGSCIIKDNNKLYVKNIDYLNSNYELY